MIRAKTDLYDPYVSGYQCVTTVSTMSNLIND